MSKKEETIDLMSQWVPGTEQKFQSYAEYIFLTDSQTKMDLSKNQRLGCTVTMDSVWRKALTELETKHIEKEFEPILRRFLFKQYAHVIFNHSNICIPAGSKPWRQRNEMEFGDITASTEKLIEEIAEVVGWPKDQLVLAYKILTQQALMEQLENMSNCDYCTNIYP